MCDGSTQCDSAVPPVRGGMILLNRNISILSVMVMMTVAVMATVTVAFATPNEGGNGQPRVEVCHKGKIITVAQPAVAAMNATVTTWHCARTQRARPRSSRLWRRPR